MNISDVLYHAESGIVILESTDDAPFLFLTRDEDLYPDLLYREDEFTDDLEIIEDECNFINLLTQEVVRVDLPSFTGRIHLNVAIGDLMAAKAPDETSWKGYTILCAVNGANFTLADDAEKLTSAMSLGVSPSSSQFAAIPSELVVKDNRHYITLDVSTLLEAQER